MNVNEILSSITRTIGYSLTHPVESAKNLNHLRVINTGVTPPPRLLNGRPRDLPGGSSSLTHIAAFVDGNAGDVLLPIVLRDLFDKVGEQTIDWKLNHAHPLFESEHAENANATRGIIVGGGGLFLRDTNANENSGWQWNCPVDVLRKVEVPIAVFAVGYNRFRGQEDFLPVFKQHLRLLTEKAVFVGLRNQGSIEAVKGYLPAELHGKVRLQPCMTTLLSKLYPDLMSDRKNGRFRIAFNAAFDRPEMRFAGREVETLLNLCKGLKQGAADAEVDVVSHCVEDNQILPFVREAGINHRYVNLMGASAEKIVRYYAGVDLAVGMRGHAQMIPFGCGTPIISLVSHDKLRWFLDDIKRQQWGVEVTAESASSELVERIKDVRLDPNRYRQEIAGLQEELWAMSCKNVNDALHAFGVSRSQM